MDGTIPAETTHFDQFPLQKDLEDAPFDSTAYRRASCSLVYLMVSTRPELAFSAGQLLQFMNNRTLAFLK